MSEKRYLGWEAEEWHEFVFDDNGRHVGTVVTREPEWDDAQRENMEALAAWEAGVCSCGFHKDQTSDRSNGFEPGQTTCSVCAGIERYQRVLGEEDEEAINRLGENVPAATPLPSDGRHLYVRPLSPAEVEERLTRRREAAKIRATNAPASRGRSPSGQTARPSPAQRS